MSGWQGAGARPGTDYVDLLLIHWPNAGVPLGETLGAMSELRDEGKARRLGVSNLPSRLVRETLELAPIICDQVEYHPYLGQPARAAVPKAASHEHRAANLDL